MYKACYAFPCIRESDETKTLKIKLLLT